MKLYTTLFCLCLGFYALAQTQSGLVAYYSMDDCNFLDNSLNGNNGTTFNMFCDSCGVQGSAVKFVDPSTSSNNDHSNSLLLGTVNSNFKTNDFTISFYMKPTDNLGVKDILSKREDCDDNHAFAMQFIPATNSINVLLTENNSKKVNVTAPLDFGKCWQHVVFVRRNKTSLLYINGVLKAERDSPDGMPINLDNVAVLSVANSPCRFTLEVPYQGFLDEMYIYKKALDEEEIAELDNNPHAILNNNVTIFLGESVDLEATESCNVTYEWSPAAFLSATDQTSVVSTPDTSILYTMSWTEDFVCISYDTVRITVIDPANLDCGKIYLPKAFTPNNDNLNDTYGISNPYAVQEGNLLSFEIFDRWGSRVFSSENPFTQWDGSFNGQAVNPGILLYRVKYICDGEELIDVGSLVIMR
jgi:gliding motility-associated-like protein